MSLGQLGTVGKQNNKLYQISVDVLLENYNVKFCFYSSQKINSFAKLCSLLLTCDNQTMRVFTDSYTYQSDRLYIVPSIRYLTPTSITVYYYVNDGQGWRIDYISRGTFYISEV